MDRELVTIVKDDLVKIIEIEKERPCNVVISGRGPRGEQGPPGFSDAGFLLPVFMPIAKNRALSVYNGDVIYADNTTFDTRTIGFSKDDVQAGREVQVITNGQIDFLSDIFVPGLDVYLFINGGVTQVPPISGIVQKVGIAYNEHVLLVDIKQPIILQ